jgi:hypothetical protein
MVVSLSLSRYTNIICISIHSYLDWQHQAVVDVGSYYHPVFSLVVPLATANRHDVRDRALGPKLKVVGVDQP